MKIEFDKSFYKSLDKFQSPIISKRIEHVIFEFDKAETIADVKNIKKLVGFRNYYRIRLGDYRLGIELKNQSTVRFILIAHRKDIYHIFP
jgi:mRNA interferase RelE/StbE